MDTPPLPHEPRKLKPSMAELVRHSMAFDRFCVHLACRGPSADGSHALLAWEPPAFDDWARRAGACFPDLTLHNLLSLRLAHASSSERLAERMGALHGLIESAPEPSEEDYVGCGPDFWRHEPIVKRAFRLVSMFPDRISNPSTFDRVQVSHHWVDCDETLRQRSASSLLCAHALSDELLDCWGPARIRVVGPAGLGFAPGAQTREIRADPTFQAALASLFDSSAIEAALGSVPLPSPRPAPRI